MIIIVTVKFTTTHTMTSEKLKETLRKDRHMTGEKRRRKNEEEIPVRETPLPQ